MGKNRIIKLFFSASGVIIVAKILGFIRQMFTASTFGATLETDMISLSQGFIGNLEYLLLQTLITSFLPVYISAREKGEEKGRLFASVSLKLFIGVALILTTGLIVGAPLFSRIIAPSYNQEMSQRLSSYIIRFSPLIISFVVVAIFRALLNADGKFVPGEMVGVNQSVITLVMIILFSKRIGVDVLVFGSYVYSVTNVLYLGILSNRFWQLRNVKVVVSTDVRKMLRMMPPLFFGYSMVYINQIVDKMLISGIESGAVTAVSYASTLSSLVTTFISAFCTVMFTYVTRNIANDKHEEAAKMVIRAATILVSVVLPICIITIICAKDIVTIVFARGMFSQVAVKNASYALCGYAIMFVPFIFRELFGQFQYGYQESKRPMINSTVGIIINIVLSIVLCPKFGIFGVAFATSVSVVVCGGLNVYTARKHNGFLRYKTFGLKSCFWLVGGGVCIIVCMLCREHLAHSNILVRLCVTMICGLVSYSAIVSPVIWQVIKKSK